jgi:hypothetical protein
MANVQKQFEQFDEAIKLRRYHENAKLAEKRERVLKSLSDGIAQQRREGAKIPSYRDFNQGSYDVGTGVKPPDGDYDIDVGVEFDLAKADHEPVDVKTWVLTAVKDHTTNVVMRRSCVTVYYMQGDEPQYHVDLAVYSKADRNPDRKMYLARGKEHSSKENQEWTPSAPEELTDKINNRFEGDDARQFRQAIRALKRWKDHRFQSEGQAAPRGIALAVAALSWFSPATREVEGEKKRDNLAALVRFVQTLLRQFSPTIDEHGKPYSRIKIVCPVEPFDDLCARMTAEQMRQFHARVETLLEALEEAQEDPDPHTACETLRVEFGDDFPVPPKKDTGSRRGSAITSSGDSG